MSHLNAKATAHALPAKDSLDAIKYNIEEDLVREVVRSIKRGQVYGNTGSHQATLATAAVVLDSSDPEETYALTMLNHWVTADGQATDELAQHTPSIGDSGGPGRPRTLVTASECLHAFQVTGQVEQV